MTRFDRRGRSDVSDAPNADASPTARPAAGAPYLAATSLRTFRRSSCSARSARGASSTRSSGLRQVSGPVCDDPAVNFLGVDLAWASPTQRKGNETGVVALTEWGEITAAGWTVGVAETAGWLGAHADDDACAFVDAPLVVYNETGQRQCERETGQRYWRASVSANSTNRRSPRLAGVDLVGAMIPVGWRYDDGLDGPGGRGRTLSECYPYTTIVGAEELGFDVRPRYKRRPRKMRAAEFRPIRAAACDLLVTRLDGLAQADPPLHLRSHPATAKLVKERSPLDDRAYKHREDLVDAVICAWTAALWQRFGLGRCHVLGAMDGVARPAPTIIAPGKPDQRCPV